MASVNDESPSGKKHLLGGALADLRAKSAAAIEADRLATPRKPKPGEEADLVGPQLEVAEGAPGFEPGEKLPSDHPPYTVPRDFQITIDKALEPAPKEMEAGVDISAAKNHGIDKEFMDSLAYEEGGDRISDGKGNMVSNLTPEGNWKPYTDSAGYRTVGVGHKIGDGKSGDGKYKGGIPKAEVDALFQKDLAKAAKRARTGFGAEEYDALPIKAKQMLVDFTFNMGLLWVEDFPKMTAALRKHDLAGALKESGRGYHTPSGEFRRLTKRNERFLKRYSE